MDGSKWQDLDVEVATDEGPRKATKFYVNGSEQVVSIETHRGYRIQGTPTHRIKVIDADGNSVWRRMAEVREGDRAPIMLGSIVGEPQEVALPRLVTSIGTQIATHACHASSAPSSPSSPAISWETARYMPGDCDCA